MEADAHCGVFVFMSMHFREKMEQSCSHESFRDKNNMRLVVLHQWEELGSPFLFSLLLSPSHPPLSPLFSALQGKAHCSVVTAAVQSLPSGGQTSIFSKLLDENILFKQNKSICEEASGFSLVSSCLTI